MITNCPSKEAILGYLEARFEFEPLPHYAMVAIQLCDIDEPLPRFAREFLTYVTDRFFTSGFSDPDEPAGKFPEFTSNQDRPVDQWRRAEDCILFMSDVKAAMEQQAERLELVEAVEAGKMKGQPLLHIFSDLAIEIDDNHDGLEKQLERRWRAIRHPERYTSGPIPVALLPDGEIAFREVKTGT